MQKLSLVSMRKKMLNSILKLFRRSDPDTSREAAEYVQEFAKSHESLIIAILQNDEVAASQKNKFNFYLERGMTKSEMAYLIPPIYGFKLDATQICRRMKKLEEDGKVIRTELKRKNASGRSETVWRLS